MRWLAALVPLAWLLSARPARAADPEPAISLFAGAAVNVAGFIAGGALLATAHSNRGLDNAGWLTMESGFTLSPLVAHGVANEWGRGVLFAAVPGAALGTTGGIFAGDSGAVERGELPEQRWMWGLFGVGLFASAVGVVDAMLAPGRTVHAAPVQIVPAVGVGRIGLRIGGSL